MTKNDIIDKLKKIKELADKGVGGEKDTAQRMYDHLKSKYEINDEEVIEDKVEEYWFHYRNECERNLIIRIVYMVTGSTSTYRYTGRRAMTKAVGAYLTELEYELVNFYYEFYRPHLAEDLDTFMIAFASKNGLFPSGNERLYEEKNDDEDETEDDIEHKMKMYNAAMMMSGLEKHTPITNVIEDKESCNEDR